MKKTILAAALLSVISVQAVAKESVTMTQVMYQEASPGQGSYPYRILVNDEYLRFDGGQDDDGYILFDRKLKKVISVNHGDQTRFIIQPEVSKPYEDKSINVELVSSLLLTAPKIQGIEAELHDIVANENLCRQVLSFKGLLPKVTSAWKEYEEVIQTQNHLSLSRTPKDMQTDCFITNNITHASQFLSFGLPYSIKSIDGSLRILQGYSEVKKPILFITPPKDYREFSL